MGDSFGIKTETVFSKQGFKILQNIDNRMALSSQVKRARDPVTLKNNLEEAGKSSKQPEDSKKLIQAMFYLTFHNFQVFLGILFVHLHE